MLARLFGLAAVCSLSSESLPLVECGEHASSHAENKISAIHVICS